MKWPKCAFAKKKEEYHVYYKVQRSICTLVKKKIYMFYYRIYLSLVLTQKKIYLS